MNLIAGIITLCVICAFAVGISMLIKKHPTTKVPPSNKTELWSDKQITELERILDNSFGNGSVLIPPSKLFTDEIKKCIVQLNRKRSIIRLNLKRNKLNRWK